MSQAKQLRTLAAMYPAVVKRSARCLASQLSRKPGFIKIGEEEIQNDEHWQPICRAGGAGQGSVSMQHYACRMQWLHAATYAAITAPVAVIVYGRRGLEAEVIRLTSFLSVQQQMQL
ncbi:hypothetical protein BKA62DRAFT_671646 [Auriculariales sp. MPI-PUGE-AT-0066]|nr:hypothetical protein BKA62DRAFT_671646 [Auriculariales sp. MPI-PUGE-AT-0066]